MSIQHQIPRFRTAILLLALSVRPALSEELSAHASPSPATAPAVPAPEAREPVKNVPPPQGPERILDWAQANPMQRIELMGIILTRGSALITEAAEIPATRLELVREIISPEPNRKEMDEVLDRYSESLHRLADEIAETIFAVRGVFKEGQHQHFLRKWVSFRMNPGYRPGKRAARVMEKVRQRVARLHEIGQDIELGADQRTELKRIYIGAAPEFVRDGAQIISHGMALVALLIPWELNQDEVREHLHGIISGVDRVVRRMVAVGLEARDVLSPSQMERFVSLIDLKDLLRPAVFDRLERGPDREEEIRIIKMKKAAAERPPGKGDYRDSWKKLVQEKLNTHGRNGAGPGWKELLMKKLQMMDKQ